MPKLEYRTLLSVDVEKSSGRGRLATNDVHRALREAVADSLARNGIAWADSTVRDLGDGFTIVAPPGTAKADLLNAVIYDLALRLRQHNHAEGPGSKKQIRVRAALNAGEVELDPGGFVAGRPLEILARLLDAAELREALKTASAGTPLALIMSRHYYDDAVRYGSLAVLPEDFASSHVAVKEFAEEVWLFVPAFAARTHPSDPPPPSEPSPIQPTSTRPQPDSGLPNPRGGAVPTPLEIDSLAAVAATALVTAMATDSWSAFKKLITTLFHRIGTERARSAQTRLDSDAMLVEGAREPETARQALLTPWTTELGALLRSAPGSAAELSALLAAYHESGRAAGRGRAAVTIDQTTVVTNGGMATVVGQGSVYQVPIPPSRRSPTPPGEAEETGDSTHE